MARRYVATQSLTQLGPGIISVVTGRCQNDQMPIMKITGRRVLAPSSVPAEDGKYHDLPGIPVRNPLSQQGLH